MDSGFDPSAALAHQLANSGSYSPISFSPSPPSSPLAYKSVMTTHSPLQVKSPPPRVQSTTTSAPGRENESHRVTDFALLHFRNVLSPIIGEIVIEDVLIPIIVEVKTYRRWECDDKHPNSVSSRSNGLIEAQDDVSVQVQYLFSGRLQPSVIAIAGAGPFWQFRQFFKADSRRTFGDEDDEDFIPNVTVLDQTRGSRWSHIIYKIGTDRSNNMLVKIRNWAGAFLHPTDSQLITLTACKLPFKL